MNAQATPITLKTLRQASLQEIFHQAARHLLTQNAKSRAILSNGHRSCAYRGDHGLKCALGVFIADEEYTSAMEGRGAYLV